MKGANRKTYSQERNFKRFISHDRSEMERFYRSLRLLHRNEKGGMIFSLIFAVVGMGVMVGFVTNLASETIERERLQHAADSLAYASGVWFARAMNTTCSINHVLGERTGYAVAINALCGPETKFDPCKEEKDMTERLKLEGDYKIGINIPNPLDMKKYAPMPDSKGEKNLVKESIENFTDKYYPENEEYRAGAGLYDAKMNLKYWATDCLNNKSIATFMMGAEKTPPDMIGTTLSELEACAILGKGIHYTESFVMGYSVNSALGSLGSFGIDGININIEIPGVGDLDFSELSNMLDQASSGLGSISDNLSSIGEGIQGVGDAVSGLGSQISGYANQFNALKNEINGLIPDLGSLVPSLKDLGLDVSGVNNLVNGIRNDVASVGSDLSSVISSLSHVSVELSASAQLDYSNADSKFSNAISINAQAMLSASAKVDITWKEMEELSRKLEQLTSKLNNCLNTVTDGLNRLDDITNSLQDKLNSVSNQIKNKLESLTKAFDSITKNIDKLVGKIQEVGQNISNVGTGLLNVSGAVSNVQGRIDQLNQLLRNPGAAISGAISNAVSNAVSNAISEALDISNITVERDKLIKLEKKLADKESGSHAKREEIYDSIEKMQNRFATIVGSPEQDPDQRLLYKRIKNTADELKKAYAVETTPKDEGFAKYVVAPMDSLVPDSDVFKAGKESSVKSSKTAIQSSSSLTNKNGIVKRPLLPVLAEDETKKQGTAGTSYLMNVKNQAWKRSSSSPYGQLPKSPWEGTDEDSFVPTVNETIEALIIGAEVAYAAAIVYYCCEFRFFEAGYAGNLLGCMIELQLRGINEDDWRPGKHGHKNNPSVWSYPTNEFDYKKEQQSQWVRATYPVVDTVRGKLRKKYKNEVPISNLSTYLTTWSYRYTLSESYYLHTGAERPYQEGKANKVIKKSCYMYVLAGTNMENKGEESFWERPEVLDQMFSVCAVVRSNPRDSAAGTKTFKRMGQKNGIMAAAQATFYPSNGRNLAKSGKLATYKTADLSTAKKLKDGNRDNPKYYEKCQPYTCWDTLQWKNNDSGKEPVIYAPEWWNDQPAFGPDADSYEELVNGDVSTLESSQIELSWEAMLSPVTQSRLERVAVAPDADKTIKHAAKNAAAHAETLAN